MQSKLDIIAEAATEYREASKREKGEMLDILVKLTGYNRSYASHLLGLCKKKMLLKGPDGKVCRVVSDPKMKKPRKRKRLYGPEVLKPLRRIWVIMDYACGKRLAPCIHGLDGDAGGQEQGSEVSVRGAEPHQREAPLPPSGYRLGQR